jgi:TRAP-type C4-dicarboxylate transport system substrate-binding protein
LQIEEFAQMLKQRSDGRLQVTVYPGGQLYHDKYMIAAIRSGACEIGALYPFNLATIEPGFRFFGIPMAINNRHELKYILEGAIGKKLFDSLEAKGIQPVGVVAGFISEEIGVISKTPVHLPSDLSGKKIRSTCTEQVVYFEQYCDASSAYVSGAELYMALQRGTIDAVVGSLTHQVTRRLYEVAPCMTMLPITANPNIFIMNKEYHDSLPEDLKDVIATAAKEMRNRSFVLSEDLYDAYLSKAKSLSREVHIPTEAEFNLWSAHIDDFWNTITVDQPEVRKIIMQIKRYRAQRVTGG